MKIEWKSCFKVGVSIFLLYLCIHYWKLVSTFFSGTLGALIPLVIGGAVAYIVNIPMGAYEKCYFPKTNKKWLIKSRRPVCLVAAYLSIARLASACFQGCVSAAAASCAAERNAWTASFSASV